MIFWELVFIVCSCYVIVGFFCCVVVYFWWGEFEFVIWDGVWLELCVCVFCFGVVFGGLLVDVVLVLSYVGVGGVGMRSSVVDVLVGL